MSRMDFSMNLFPFEHHCIVISFSEFSAVNFIAGWNVLVQ